MDKMANKILVLYLFIGMLFAGHWLANEFSMKSDNFTTSNPVMCIPIGFAWPVYASYILFSHVK